MNDDRLVYSTDSGRIKTPTSNTVKPEGDGILRIHRETKGRKGAGVSVVKGLDSTAVDMKALAKTLKKSLGAGGSVKGATIEIQTSNREKISDILKKQGFDVKIVGG